MSYDLYFCSSPAPTTEEFEGHFSNRSGFLVDGTRASYSNEDTGVYFGFELLDEASQADLAEEHPSVWASFELNYCRPSYFALEAAIELEAFVARFGDQVSDPQLEGIQGRYSTDAFLRAWNHGNRFGYQAVHASRGTRPPTKPTAELVAIWRWNYNRARLQAQLGERVFVPRIFVGFSKDQLISASTWVDAIATVLPKTDAVLVGRDQFAPRRWFRKVKDPLIVPWRDIAPTVAKFRSQPSPLTHYFLDYANAPPALARWVQTLPIPNSKPQLLSPEEVLDTELADGRGESTAFATLPSDDSD